MTSKNLSIKRIVVFKQGNQICVLNFTDDKVETTQDYDIKVSIEYEEN